MVGSPVADYRPTLATATEPGIAEMRLIIANAMASGVQRKLAHGPISREAGTDNPPVPKGDSRAGRCRPRRSRGRSALPTAGVRGHERSDRSNSIVGVGVFDRAEPPGPARGSTVTSPKPSSRPAISA